MSDLLKTDANAILRLLDRLEESNKRAPWYDQKRRRELKFIEFRRQDSDGGGSRSKRALSKSEAGAHNTAADAKATISMMRWPYGQAANLRQAQSVQTYNRREVGDKLKGQPPTGDESAGERQ